MTYTVSTIAGIADIPALFSAFATARGFTVDTSTPSEPTVKHPSLSGAEAFVLKITTSGLLHDVSLSSATVGVATNTAIARSPILRGVGGVDAVVIPTKLHLFGGLTPQPFIAGVIEYGYNLYRHFYFGHAEQLSTYGGGEIITGSAQGISTASTSYPVGPATTNHRAMPFNALHTYWSAAQSNGGMRLVHAGNPTTWRKFGYGGAMSADNIDNSFSVDGNLIVLGGFGDSVNSGYALAGKSQYSGAQVLVPVNLFIGKRVSSTQSFQAVGRPAGVRLVNMEDLDPGSEVTVGSSVWRVFPVFSKSSQINLLKATETPTTNTYPTNNTSFNHGMAYLVNG